MKWPSRLGGLVLELRHPRQLAVRQRALHHPRRAASARARGSARRPWRCRGRGRSRTASPELDRGLADDPRLLRDGQRVQVDDPVEDLLLVLAGDPVAQRTQIVAEVDVAGGLDAREHTSHEQRGYRGTRSGSWLVRIGRPGDAEQALTWPVRYGQPDDRSGARVHRVRVGGRRSRAGDRLVGRRAERRSSTAEHGGWRTVCDVPSARGAATPTSLQ